VYSSRYLATISGSKISRFQEKKNLTMAVAEKRSLKIGSSLFALVASLYYELDGRMRSDLWVPIKDTGLVVDLESYLEHSEVIECAKNKADKYENEIKALKERKMYIDKTHKDRLGVVDKFPTQSQLAPNVSRTVYRADAGSGYREENVSFVSPKKKRNTLVVVKGEQESDIVFSDEAAETDHLSVH
jgi:hypothetical protein